MHFVLQNHLAIWMCPKFNASTSTPFGMGGIRTITNRPHRTTNTQFARSHCACTHARSARRTGSSPLQPWTGWWTKHRPTLWASFRNGLAGVCIYFRVKILAYHFDKCLLSPRNGSRERNHGSCVLKRRLAVTATMPPYSFVRTSSADGSV